MNFHDIPSNPILTIAHENFSKPMIVSLSIKPLNHRKRCTFSSKEIPNGFKKEKQATKLSWELKWQSWKINTNSLCSAYSWNRAEKKTQGCLIHISFNLELKKITQVRTWGIEYKFNLIFLSDSGLFLII